MPILRFDQLLFETPTNQLDPALRTFCKDYPSPLLHIYPDDAYFMQQLQDFVHDSTMQEVYSITRQRYRDLGWLEKELGKALQKAHEIDKEIAIDHVAAYVSGVFDYDSRVAVDRESGSVLISLDQYALQGMERYSYFGLPMYIVQLSDSGYLASDIMAEVARQYIKMESYNPSAQISENPKSPSLLDYMVMEGKVLYFLDQVMPGKGDHLKMRYTKEQLEWCHRNEAMIWAYLIRGGLLYERDFSRFHNLIDEAPKTNVFKDSAPRTPQYIGWQIVRKYMASNHCTMQQLLENTDSQSILKASGYKP